MKKTSKSTDLWLEALGYDGSVGVVHRSVKQVQADHPYSREIQLMLDSAGDIVSSAVYEIDRVPAVCFIEPTAKQIIDPSFIDEVRRKIWNQNLVSILVVVEPNQATAYPAPRTLHPAEPLTLMAASVDGPFSAKEIASGSIHSRLPTWFDRKNRVDSAILENLSIAVSLLASNNLNTAQAQLLLGKCIFVSYLEDRGIIGSDYRDRHKVGSLLSLLRSANAQGLDKLFRTLKRDFNGDLLDIEGGSNVDWKQLGESTFSLLAEFLLHTRLKDGQRSLWRYDFKYIPVELISGIYESFLSHSQVKQGAFYTPRHLASLAVDEAFRGIKKPWTEVVLDGACGSGILITSAYRRMLGAMRAAQKSALTYEDRRTVLMNGIRGSDISAAACKVTAFSLYLVLLEDLAPNDIARLQEDQQVKLPPLIGAILAKEEVGDFFDAKNLVIQNSKPTIVISNPPWFEPADGDSRLYEDWWRDRYKNVLPRRQIALAFVRRATELVIPGGRLCLILPAAVLGAADTGPYLLNWFREFMPERIFNLADMRRVLFDGAVHPTAIITGKRRLPADVGKIPPREAFEYFVPKSDVSLAFGRLTVHGFDRKKLLSHAACNDAEVLRTYFWGNELDESLIARLRLNGRFKDHAQGENSRFIICKGFHLTDNSKAPSDAKPLRKYPYLSTASGKGNYPKNRLFITPGDLKKFPKEIDTVADFGSRNGAAFNGVRVIFPDGADNKTLEIRACYADTAFSFMQTAGAIIDRQGDKELMRFVTAYLRSKLARYLLFYTTFSLVMERPHIKLAEIERLPFAMPDLHENPKRARTIINKVCDLLKPFEQDNEDYPPARWAKTRNQIDALIYDYFDLSSTERKVVEDTCEFFIPARQPVALSALNWQLMNSPSENELKAYGEVLRHELETWRHRFDGSGQFDIDIKCPRSRTLGTQVIVRIGIQDEEKSAKTTHDFTADIARIIDELSGDENYPQVGDETLSFSSDFLINHGGSYYLVKPMIKRLWLAGAAAQDAYRVVQTVREGL